MELAERALKEMADSTPPASVEPGLDAPGGSPGPGVAPTDSTDGRDPPAAPIDNSKESSDRKHETGAPDDKKKPGDSKQPKDIEWFAKRSEVRGLAERALVYSPLEARAFRILGDVAPEGSGEPFMRAALRRSLSESRAAYSLMKTSFVKQKYADAARYADILLRSRPNMMKSVAPYLVRMAETEDATPDVVRVLKNNPPWRVAFFAELLAVVTNAGTPLRLMLPLKTTPFPVIPDELNYYLTLLKDKRLFDFAYFVWDQNLTGEKRRELDLLFNGDFNHTPTVWYFDWSIVGSGKGVTIQIAPLPDEPRRRGLGLSYGPGRADAHYVAEYIRLGPGAYRMTGSYRGDLAGGAACVGASHARRAMWFWARARRFWAAAWRRSARATIGSNSNSHSSRPKKTAASSM